MGGFTGKQASGLHDQYYPPVLFESLDELVALSPANDFATFPVDRDVSVVRRDDEIFAK